MNELINELLRSTADVTAANEALQAELERVTGLFEFVLELQVNNLQSSQNSDLAANEREANAPVAKVRTPFVVPAKETAKMEAIGRRIAANQAAMCDWDTPYVPAQRKNSKKSSGGTA